MSSLKAAACIYPYTFDARVHHTSAKKGNTECVVRRKLLATIIITYPVTGLVTVSSNLLLPLKPRAVPLCDSP